MTAEARIQDMAARARRASATLAQLPAERTAEALRAAAAAVREQSRAILAANAEDMANASALSAAIRDRLMLDGPRVEGIAAALEAVAALPSPLGQEIDRSTRPNGLVLQRVRVPIGVVGIIFESRPNVTADAGALCLRAGNAAILRGGSEARASNRALHAALLQGLSETGLPEAAIQLVDDPDRALVGAMLRAAGAIDLIIPRGGRSLVAAVQQDARVPVLAHLDGNNHVYVHAAADPEMARRIVLDAKLRRMGVCGAMETLLIDAAFPAAAALVGDLLARGCEVRGDRRAQALDPQVEPADEQDWNTEYLDAICSVAIVDGLEAALAHIAAHGSGHTDAIVTADQDVADRFLDRVDSAIVLHNASTQFADGGEFGLGAEIGIATGRLHARGPVALEGLTTYKWVGRGTGQVRG
ncbi:glutamate-5-semialdehyde dehydrogenase [Sphingomonas sp.]|jgi:glutamate-5-semialdehyde dehydrogenase|uniref:glutamate-5-semialdehyde dehydrogenase n=1 Tax=Sphingomonas sp. TaxID=28214 RepID=UPI002DEAA4FD|nr:glutamate-5-semialdehyde dehydrogenase [Sphingomonas sp.]HEV2568471.1 glutamate-5-semialdehyde dehydrogenase [Sphingomonas sp.]